jgi:hypothetical protein
MSEQIKKLTETATYIGLKPYFQDNRLIYSSGVSESYFRIEPIQQNPFMSDLLAAEDAIHGSPRLF